MSVILTAIDQRLKQVEEEDPARFERYYSLWKTLESIIEDSNNHLRQITTQLSHFDIHDDAHSQRVLENMEKLLGKDGVELRTTYELILLYAAAYLHDAAMALPQWEYAMLTAVEGTEHCHDPRCLPRLNNDLKPVQSLTDIVAFISENRHTIYGEFTSVIPFVFSLASEEAFCRDLAERTREYEDFRSRYTDELEARSGDTAAYLRYSESLRCEFIRSTHPLRAETYILNLRRHLTAGIGTAAAERFVRDLAAVCRAHGEDFSYVESLPTKGYLFDESDFANLPFISILLRLGDILHFSKDRAPTSLFAEKQITDPDSMKHWRAKFQDLHYQIADRDGKRTIRFSAYCTEPDMYYFIQDYLDGVDRELNGYYAFIHDLEFREKERAAQYQLPLERAVDREQVVADRAVFIPEPDMKFTLDQARILELLMGVNLYKDPYLCLRELYQNSLDACRCMAAQNRSRSLSEKMYIEFGLKVDSENKAPYLYCLDNGTGMTQEIVRRYLLKIGNSYYRSRDFVQKNTGWNGIVTPTSQFGIGILSCYMLADRLEITTQSYEDGAQPFRFSLDGPNERFYSLPPDKLDCEKLGHHGTLVKLYLNDKFLSSLHNQIPDPLIPFLYKFGRYPLWMELPDDYAPFMKSLFYRVNSQVGIPSPLVDVGVRGEDGKLYPLIPCTRVLNEEDVFSMTEEQLRDMATIRYRQSGNTSIENLFNCRDDYASHLIVLEKDGIQAYLLLPLPTGRHPIDEIPPSLWQYIWEGKTFLVDGIYCDPPDEEYYKIDKIWDTFNYLNFTGPLRPQLSIDRNSITTFSEELLNTCNSLFPLAADRIINTITDHIHRCGISHDSISVSAIMDYLIRNFDSLSGPLLTHWISSPLRDAVLSDLTRVTGSTITVGNLVTAPEIVLHGIRAPQLRLAARELLVRNLMESSHIRVLDDAIIYRSSTLYSESLGLYSSNLDVYIRADSWEGRYTEYDLVSHFWPVVPQSLFHHINMGTDGVITDRWKYREQNHRRTGSISCIAQLDPILINSRFGLSTGKSKIYPYNYDHHHHDGSLNDGSLIGYRGQEILFSLFELNNSGVLPHEEKKDYILYAYIAPRELNEEESRQLLLFETDDPDYVRGVREGWSVLFLGATAQTAIFPGLKPREEAVRDIPSYTRNQLDPEVTYLFVDGTVAISPLSQAE